MTVTDALRTFLPYWGRSRSRRLQLLLGHDMLKLWRLCPIRLLLGMGGGTVEGIPSARRFGLLLQHLLVLSNDWCFTCPTTRRVEREFTMPTLEGLAPQSCCRPFCA